MRSHDHPSPRPRTRWIDSGPLRDDPPPWLRVVGVFDLETTGIDVRSDRVVTAHVGLLDATGAAVCGRSWRADPGVEIPAAATAVHGISTAQARATGRPAAEVVAEVVGCLRGILDAGIPVVAYNAAYDFTLLRHEACVTTSCRWSTRIRSSIHSSSTGTTTATGGEANAHEGCRALRRPARRGA